MGFKNYIDNLLTESLHKKDSLNIMVVLSKQNPEVEHKLERGEVYPNSEYRFKGINVDHPSKITEIFIEQSKDYLIIQDVPNNKYIKIIAPAKTTLKMFIHNPQNKGGGGFSTEAKEMSTLYVLQGFYNGGDYSEDQILKKLDHKPEVSKKYRHKFYISAVSHISNLKSIGLSGRYIFERDGTNDKNARMIRGVAANHGADSNGNSGNKNAWNPADIWLFSSTIVNKLSGDLSKLTNLFELNNYMTDRLKDKTIIPISLKKSASTTASKLILPNQKNEEERKFNFSYITTTYEPKKRHALFASVFFMSDSSEKFSIFLNMQQYPPRVVLNPTIEGRFVKGNHQTGRVQGNSHWEIAMRNINKKNYPMYRGVAPKSSGYTTKLPSIVSEEMFNYYRKNVFIKYKSKINNPIHNYTFDSLSVDEHKKYVTIASWIQVIMIDPDEALKKTYEISTGMNRSETGKPSKFSGHYIWSGKEK